MKGVVLPRTLLAALLIPVAAPAVEVDMVEIEVTFLQASGKQWAASLESHPHISAPSSQVQLLHIVGVLEKARTDQLIASLKKEGAEIATSQKMVALNGRELVARNVRELRYPSEFSPAKDGSGEVYPIAFDTREVGTRITLTPTIGPDGATINLLFSPRIDEFRGFVDASQLKPDTDTRDPETLKRLLQTPLKKGSPWQPIFDTREITAEVTVYDGCSVLLIESSDLTQPDASLKGVLLTVRLAPKK